MLELIIYFYYIISIKFKFCKKSYFVEFIQVTTITEIFEIYGIS